MKHTINNRKKTPKNKSYKRMKRRFLKKTQKYRNKNLTNGITMKRRNYKGGVVTKNISDGRTKRKAINFNTNIVELKQLAKDIKNNLSQPSISINNYNKIKEDIKKINRFIAEYKGKQSTTIDDKLLQKDKNDLDIINSIIKNINIKTASLNKDMSLIGSIWKTYQIPLSDTNTSIQKLNELYKTPTIKKSVIQTAINTLTKNRDKLESINSSLPKNMNILQCKRRINDIKNKLTPILSKASREITVGNKIIMGKFSHLNYQELQTLYRLQAIKNKTPEQLAKVNSLVKKEKVGRGTVTKKVVKPILDISGNKPQALNMDISGNKPQASKFDTTKMPNRVKFKPKLKIVPTNEINTLLEKGEKHNITKDESVKLNIMANKEIKKLNLIPDKEKSSFQRNRLLRLMGARDKTKSLIEPKKTTTFSTTPGLPTKDRTISINITLPEHFYVAQNDQGQNDASTSISEVMSQLQT